MTPRPDWHFPALICLILVLSFLGAGCITPKESTHTETGAAACQHEETIFLTEALYPFSYIGNNGSPEGQVVGVVRELSWRLNCSSRIEVRTWNDAYQTALTTPGYAVFATARTPDREEKFAWVGPIGTFDYMLYARNGSGITLQSLEAARSAGTIAVVAGDAREVFLTTNQFNNTRAFPSDADCLDALMNGSVSLWIGSSATVPETLQRRGIPGSALLPVYPLQRIEIFIAFNRGTAPGTIRAYQEALDMMKADGTYQRITGTGGSLGVPSMTDADRRTLAGDTLLPALFGLISARIHGIAAALETLAITGEARSGDWEAIRPLLVRLEQEYPEARFWFARPDGSYYTTVDNLTSASLKDRPYFPGVLAGRTSIGTIVVSKSTGRNTAIIAVPVMDKGTVNGVLGASVYCDILEQALFRDVPLPGGYYAFVLDKDGMPVLDSLPDRIFSLAGPAVTEIQEKAGGMAAYQSEGSLHRAVFRTENLTGWKVAIGWRE